MAIGRSLTALGIKLIHPPTRAAAILFWFIIRWTEIAILVKIVFGVLIVLLHVHLKFSPGTAAFPSVIAIADPVGGFRS